MASPASTSSSMSATPRLRLLSRLECLKQYDLLAPAAASYPVPASHDAPQPAEGYPINFTLVDV